MTVKYQDRVKDTTTTTGTGTLTLAGAPPTGFRAFSAFTDQDQVYYTIDGGAEWEVGQGVYTSSGTTLSRVRVLASSNAGALVNFSAGTKTVFATMPAERIADVEKALVPISTAYYVPFVLNAGASGALISTRKYFSPAYVPAGTYTKAAFRLAAGVASTLVRLGVYNRSAATGLPTTLLSGGDLGEVDTASGTLKALTGLSLVVPADGWYLLACHASGAPQVRGTTSGFGIGYFGSDFTGTTSAILAVYRDTTYGTMASDETGNSFTSVYNTGATTIPFFGVAL